MCLDVLGVFMTLLRFLHLYLLKFGFSTRFFSKHYGLVAVLVCSYMFNFVSEYDKTAETKRFFIITHSIWHISIFILMARVYQLFTVKDL